MSRAQVRLPRRLVLPALLVAVTSLGSALGLIVLALPEAPPQRRARALAPVRALPSVPRFDCEAAAASVGSPAPASLDAPAVSPPAPAAVAAPAPPAPVPPLWIAAAPPVGSPALDPTLLELSAEPERDRAVARVYLDVAQLLHFRHPRAAWPFLHAALQLCPGDDELLSQCVGQDRERTLEWLRAAHANAPYDLALSRGFLHQAMHGCGVPPSELLDLAREILAQAPEDRQALDTISYLAPEEHLARVETLSARERDRRLPASLVQCGREAEALALVRSRLRRRPTSRSGWPGCAASLLTKGCNT